MKVNDVPRLYCTVKFGPFTAEEWKDCMEKNSDTPFKFLRMSKKKLQEVFNRFLYEKKLYISRDKKLLTYFDYLSLVDDKPRSEREYFRHLKNIENYDEDLIKNPTRAPKSYFESQRDYYDNLRKMDIEREDQFKDQFDYWRKNWSVDEDRFVKSPE